MAGRPVRPEMAEVRVVYPLAGEQRLHHGIGLHGRVIDTVTEGETLVVLQRGDRDIDLSGVGDTVGQRDRYRSHGLRQHLELDRIDLDGGLGDIIPQLHVHGLESGPVR